MTGDRAVSFGRANQGRHVVLPRECVIYERSAGASAGTEDQNAQGGCHMGQV
jgi:hypothetical protein